MAIEKNETPEPIHSANKGGKGMKKKMIAAVIACSMVMTCMPGTAFADEAPAAAETNTSPAVEMQEENVEMAEAETASGETAEPEEAVQEEAEAETLAAPESEPAIEESAEPQASENATPVKGKKMMTVARANNTSQGTATPISMATGSMVTSTFSGSQMDHWYKFTLNDTRRIKMNFHYDGSQTIYAKIFAASNTNKYIFAMSGGADRITYLNKGTYYLKIGSYNTSSKRSLTYYFNVLSNQYVKDQIAEPNDTILNAAKLQKDKKYSGAIVKANENLGADADYVRYSVPKGTYRLNVKVPEALTYGGSNGHNQGAIKVYAMDANDNNIYFFNVGGTERRSIQINSGSQGSFIVNMPKGAMYFKVAYGGVEVIGKYSLELVKMPGKTSNLKVKRSGSRTLKVTCKAVSTKTGYEVKYKKKGSSKWTKKRSSKNSFTLKKLKKKTTYVVKVRTYRTVNGKTYYSSWTAAKTKKTK